MFYMPFEIYVCIDADAAVIAAAAAAAAVEPIKWREEEVEKT